jgi:membrane-associated phospholipid phosphatase
MTRCEPQTRSQPGGFLIEHDFLTKTTISPRAMANVCVLAVTSARATMPYQAIYAGSQTGLCVKVPRLRCIFFLAACVFVCSIGAPRALHGQDDPLPPTDSAPNASAPTLDASSGSGDRDVSWLKMPMNILHDQKDIWLFPGQAVRGRHWVPTVVVVSVTAALLASDPYDTPYFNHTTAYAGFNRVASSNITGIGVLVVPAAFYAVGLGRRDSYLQKTALFAGEALADTEVIHIVGNSLTTRLRPHDVRLQQVDDDTFFRNHIHIGSSFPSGHTIAAFSVATVFARRYRNHRWAPWVAYGLAGTIGFSRLTLREHFPSDVFVGAALGYVVTRYEVLQGH